MEEKNKAAKKQGNYTILSEHAGITLFRYLFALISFAAILAGTIVTFVFMQKRGAPDGILFLIYALIVINVLQLGLCAADFVLRCYCGVYTKWLTIGSFAAGILWIIAVSGELAVASIQLGGIRMDLLAIDAIQAVLAIITYIVWPLLDKGSISALTRPKVREDAARRKRKAGKYVATYGILCLLIIVAQLVALSMYKLPPRIYDLFDESRALIYEQTEDGEGYIVTGIYQGTSNTVTVPATYNGRPVVGLAKGALVDDGILEKYKVSNIELGEKSVDEDGNEVFTSNLTFIEDGAIVNDKIETISIPSSVTQIGMGAIKSTSLKTLTYEAKADFSIDCLDCDSLERITMSGDAGKIVSLYGMNSNIVIDVSKDIYDRYRKDNPNYLANFSPILDDGEICLDFYTGCDQYIGSIFGTATKGISISYTDLVDKTVSGASLSVDTLAYIKDKHEMGTAGAKENSAFRGWYEDADFTRECEMNENSPVTFYRNTSLYAKWIDEYTAQLDWGTFTPEGAARKISWTDEDLVSFPDCFTRLGYEQQGVSWQTVDRQEEVEDSRDLHRSVDLKATWILDAPVVTIDHTLTTKTGRDEHTTSFTYDEQSALQLDASFTHPLKDQILKNAKSVKYNWTKSEDPQYFRDGQNLNLKDVPDTGTYTLTIDITAPTGEVAHGMMDIAVRIDKKKLDLGTAKLENGSEEYNGESHNLKYTGEIATANTVAEYEFFNAQNDKVSEREVVNVGEYTVKATIKKSRPDEAQNYEESHLEARLTITPRKLVFEKWAPQGSEGWEAFTTVYNGEERSIRMSLVASSIISADFRDLQLTYRENTGKDAGTYHATVIGVNNPNYTIDGIEQEHRVQDWTISPKEITVTGWKLDGNSPNSIVYDGNTHNATASMDGALAADNVSFVYDSQDQYLSRAVNAGDYTAKIVGLDEKNKNNYKFDTAVENATYEWHITRRLLKVAFSDTNVPYKAAETGAVATISDFVKDDAEGLTLDMFAFDGTDSDVNRRGEGTDGGYKVYFLARDAKTYKAQISALVAAQNAKLNNYSISSEESFTITPVRLSLAVVSDNLEYNGESQDLVVRVAGLFAADIPSVQLAQFTVTGATKEAKSPDNSEYKLILSARNAGEYKITVSAFSNTNYEIPAQALESTLKITRKHLTVNGWTYSNGAQSDVDYTADSTRLEYNKGEYTLQLKVTGTVHDDSISLKYDDNKGTEVASHQATAKLADPAEGNANANYILTDAPDETVTLSWEIGKRQLHIKWKKDGADLESLSNLHYTYTAEEMEISYELDFLEGDSGTLTFSDEGLKGTNAGEYSISVTGIDSSSSTNYVLASDSVRAFNWRIDQQQVTLNWVDGTSKSLVYDGNYQGPSFTLAGLITKDLEGEGFKLQYTLSADNSLSASHSVTINSENASKPYSFQDDDYGHVVDVDKYIYGDITLTGTAAGNYTLTSSPYTLEITQKTLHLTGKWYYKNSQKGSGEYSESFVYNNHDFTLTTKIIEGDVVERLGGEDVITLNYNDNIKTDQGAYTAKVSGISGTYASNYQLAEENLTLSWAINAKRVSVTWTYEEPWIYNNSDQTVTANYDFNATSDVDGLVYSGDSLNLKYDENSKHDVGTYHATVSSGDKNYFIDPQNSALEWKIDPKPVELKWTQDTFTYNGDIQHPTASFTFNGETVNVIDYASATSNDPVNSKDAGENYSIKATALDNQNYTLENGAKNVTHNYTINKREVTLEWYEDGTATSVDNLVYNGNTRTVIARITNLVGGDQVKLTYDQNTFKDAGTHTAYVTAVDNTNYCLKNNESVKREYTVNKLTANISWSFSPSLVYDGTAKTATPTVANKVSNDSFSFTYTYRYTKPNTSSSSANGSGNSGTDAGTYTFTIEDLGNKNYALGSSSSSKSTTMTIAQQPVKIEWSGQTNVEYDGVSHTLTANVTGKNDNKSVSFTYRGSYEFKDAGDHTITIDSLKDSNYTLTGAQGDISKVLTITQHTVNLAWTDPTNLTYSYYGNNSPTAKVTNLKNRDGVDDTVNVGYTITSSSGSVVGNSSTSLKLGVGTYTVHATSLTNTNYTLKGCTTGTRQFTINKQQVSISWNGAETKVYNGYNQSRTAQVVGKDDWQHNVSFEYLNGNSFKDVGTHTITVSALDDANYTLDGAEGKTATLTIDPLAVTLSWGSDKITYSGVNAMKLEATVSNRKGSDSVTVTGYTITDKNQSSPLMYSNQAYNVGTYTVRATSLSSDNYTLTGCTNPESDFTVNPQKVNILWDGASYVKYDGASHKREATVRGVEDKVTVGFNYDESGNAFTDAGEHIITVSKLDSNNYTLDGVGYITTKLTIAPLEVQLSWGQSRITYSSVNEMKLEATVANIQASDSVTVSEYTVSATDIQATIGATATVTKVGKYTVQATKLDNDNYTLDGGVETSCTFTVDPQQVKIEWSNDSVEYDGASHKLEAEVKGADDGANVDCHYAGNNEFTAVGEHSATVVLDNENYTLKGTINATATLTIEQCKVKLEWSVDENSLGDWSVTVTNKVGEEEVRLEVEIQFNGQKVEDPVDFTQPGTYTFKVTGVTGKDSGNYTIEGVSDAELNKTVEVKAEE